MHGTAGRLGDDDRGNPFLLFLTMLNRELVVYAQQIDGTDGNDRILVPIPQHA